MRTVFIAACAMLLGGSPAVAQTMKNELLFEYCKAFVATKTATPGNEDATKANRCIAYLAGAAQVYSVAHRSCDLSWIKLDAMADDYLNLTRKAGVLAEPAAIVVHALLDDCYCESGKAPAIAKVCPVKR